MIENQGYSGAERRKFERLKVDLSLIYRINKPWYVRVLIGGNEVEASALDLSEGGIAINTNYNIPVSTVLFIKIMVYKVVGENNFHYYKTLEVEGQVRSSNPLGNGKFRTGILFTRIKDEDRQELIGFAKMDKQAET